MSPFLSTDLGRIFNVDSLDYLRSSVPDQSIDLIVTSPPFGLVRKKDYGNADSHAYVEWFKPFGREFKRVLKESGSFVIDIGGAWLPGQPTRSLYHFELLIMLCRELEFHLAQEFYWWNPARLPTPAEWVTVRRVRVKDAVDCVWWLSPTPWPKASNRRILAPYSDSMHELLKSGYRAKLRPSGHDISENFSKNNGAAIPPNLLAISNTESNSRYQRYCKEQGLKPHPARFPVALPELFIRFLTDPQDIVLDPFAGSCATGEAAESLNRRWICCELSVEYLRGAAGRFVRMPSQDNLFSFQAKSPKKGALSYKIFHPSALVDSNPVGPLPLDGGRSRVSNTSRQNSSTERTNTARQMRAQYNSKKRKLRKVA